jgi:hypothetical protein
MEKLFASHNSSDVIKETHDIFRVMVIGDNFTYTPAGFQSRDEAIRLAEDLAEDYDMVEVRQPVSIFHQLSNRKVLVREEYNVIYSSCTISLD